MSTVRQRRKAQGIDPLGVMKGMIAEASRGATAHRQEEFQLHSLKFGFRLNQKGEKQVVSVVDWGDGEEMQVFPILQRFQPPEDQEIHCYVAPRRVPVRFQGEIKLNRDGTEVTHLIGFAIPADLIAAEMDGYWRGPGNNQVSCRFVRKEREVAKKRRDGSTYTKTYVGYVGRGPNGKVVLAASGFVPPVGVEVAVQVTERINAFVAHCVVPEEIATLPAEAQEQALVRMAETVGAILEAVDNYRIKVSGRPHDACAVLSLPSTATRAEIRARYKELQSKGAPDKKTAEHRRLTKSEPPAALIQQWNHTFTLVKAAHDRMLLVLDRHEAVRKYLKKGMHRDKDMPAQVMVGQLAGRAGCSHALARKALERIGYPGVQNKTVLDRDIAWTALGLIRSGVLDDVGGEDKPASAEAKSEAKPTNGAAKAEEPVNEAALKLALAKGLQVNGRPAAEVVQELKAEGRLPPHWPDPEPEPGEEVVQELAPEDVGVVEDDEPEGQPSQNQPTQE